MSENRHKRRKKRYVYLKKATLKIDVYICETLQPQVAQLPVP